MLPCICLCVLSAGPLVLDLEAECNGFQACYVTYDTKAALALHERNLVSLCRWVRGVTFLPGVSDGESEWVGEGRNEGGREGLMERVSEGGIEWGSEGRREGWGVHNTVFLQYSIAEGQHNIDVLTTKLLTASIIFYVYIQFQGNYEFTKPTHLILHLQTRLFVNYFRIHFSVFIITLW